jgi:hypothetical protein
MSVFAISSSAPAATPATAAPAPAPATKASGGDRQAQKLLHHGTVGTKINTKA